ncbi:MAG: capsule biosynthesis protein [Minwuia sp.]|uniref:capsule biosynthesis protein n=1 Tax=Minwuia sp. TaxID=2493630 RepID=UPI003A8765FD
MKDEWRILIRLWIQTAWRLRYLICALLILLPVIGGVASQLRSRTYETKMSILIQESAKHNPFLEDLAVETRVKDRLSALNALLHSRHILLGVAIDLEWVNDDTEAAQRERVVRQLSEAVSLRLVGEELIELNYKQSSPTDIDKVLMAIARRFMEKVLAPERSSIAGSVNFLEKQIAESQQALSKAESALGAFRSDNADSLPDLHAGNMRRLADLRQELSLREVELEGANAAFADLRRRVAAANPVVLNIEHRIVQVRTDLAAMRARYTDSHSAVRAAERQLARLTAERDALVQGAQEMDMQKIEEVWGAALRQTEPDSGLQQLLVSQVEALRAAQAGHVQMQRQVEVLRAEVERMEMQTAGFGEVQRQLDTLERDVAVQRDVHEKLLKRAGMARVTGALGQFEAPERVKIIDLPTVPGGPNGLPAMAFVIAGLFAAIGAGAGLVALSEVLDSSVRTREQAAQAGPPVVAVLPRISPVELEVRNLIRLQGLSRKELLS